MRGMNQPTQQTNPLKKITLILSVVCMVLGLVHTASAAPATLTQSVTRNGVTVVMQLKRENLRGPNFQLRTQNLTGGYDVVTPVDERSYIGTVDGYPAAISSGILRDNGTFQGAIYFDRGVTWFTSGTSVVDTRGLEYATFSDFQIPTVATVSAGHGGTTMYGYELGVDASNDYFVARGSVANTFETIEYSVAVTRALYMRDVLLRPYLGRVIIRTTLAQSPYATIGSSQGQAYLDAVKAEWNNNQTDTDPDLVAGVSTNKVGGGLAYVGVIGGAGAYSVNSSGTNQVFDVTFRHEMGHNWGCGHFVGGSPEGAGIMGGNAPARFSGPEVQAILSHRDVKIAAGGVIDNEGIFTAVEIPPYASLDVVKFRQSVDPSISIAVLANDHDANGQTITVLSHDSTSSRGGTITRQGQNLIYSAPKSFLGTDYFSYVATDTAGKTATGIVLIDVEPSAELRLYLPLNETSGTATTDKSVFRNPATLSGTTFSSASIAGKFGTAINLDGVDDHVQVTEMNLNSNTVTMTAWIRQGATQNSFAGIIFDNAGPAAGLNIKGSRDLGYHWDGPALNWSWNSGLTPPVDTWTFVALVIEPTKATMYMNSGGGFQSAMNTATHYPVNFTTTYVGWEPSNNSRHFLGAIDDARIYNKALTQADLQVVYQGGGAESPTPAHGAIDVTSPILSWSLGATATSSNVYLGTSQSAVANATTASPEYQGNTTNTQYPTALANQTTYFWRVDTVTSSSTLKGRIWSFTTGTFPKSILIDLGEGGTQTLAGGELIGPTAVNSSNWNATTGASGNLAALIDSTGATTGADVQWTSAITYRNNAGTADDENRMSKGYLDDGTTSGGKGVRVTLNNIPYATYRVYGLFTSDQNQTSGSSCVIRNFNVNGTWALGGTATTTTAAWGTISANSSNNGSFWTRIFPGSVKGNYWVVDSTGTTCNIVGEIKSGTNRGSLTAVIIEDASPPAVNNPPVWSSNPINEISGYEDIAYSSSLADNASDPDGGDTLTFSKVSGSGPAWLTVAPNGDLSGTPTAGDVGPNQWTVRVADHGGLQADATLKITVAPLVGTLFVEDFERTAGTTIGNGWIEQTNDSRIFDTAQPATKMLISVAVGTPFAVVNPLSNTYLSGASYELLWKSARAGAANGTLNYDVSIGTWDGTSFTPLASQTGSIANVNIAGKIAGAPVYVTASGAEAGQQIAIRFEVLAGSSDWVGFDDITVNALGSIAAPTGFNAVAGNAQVALSWNAASNASGYALRRATSSGGSYTLLNGNLQTTSYTDNAVTNGTTYYYTVSSINAAGESDPSGEISARPLNELQAWRLANFGTIDNTGDAHDDADPDGDGATNAEEYLTGTDPNDRTSVFAITGVAENGSDLVVSFSTVAGKTYRVEWSESLDSGSWTVVETEGTPQTDIPGTGGTVQTTDSNGAGHPRRFYRASVE